MTSPLAQRLHLSREIQEAARQHRPRAHKQRDLQMLTLKQLKSETRWTAFRASFTTRELVLMAIGFVAGLSAYVGALVWRFVL